MTASLPFSLKGLFVTSISESTTILRLKEAQLFKLINQINQAFCSLGLLISRYCSRLTKTNFVFRLVSHDCRLRLLKYFSESFSKRETALSLFSCYTMLLVSVQCLDKTFLYVIFAKSCKILF